MNRINIIKIDKVLCLLQQGAQQLFILLVKYVKMIGTLSINRDSVASL